MSEEPMEDQQVVNPDEVAGEPAVKEESAEKSEKPERKPRNGRPKREARESQQNGGGETRESQSNGDGAGNVAVAEAEVPSRESKQESKQDRAPRPKRDDQ